MPGAPSTTSPGGNLVQAQLSQLRLPSSVNPASLITSDKCSTAHSTVNSPASSMRNRSNLMRPSQHRANHHHGRETDTEDHPCKHLSWNRWHPFEVLKIIELATTINDLLKSTTCFGDSNVTRASPHWLLSEVVPKKSNSTSLDN